VGDLRGLAEVGEELLLLAVDELEADVLAEVDLVDEVLDAAPRRLERLDLGGVQDRVDLGGQAAVDVGDQERRCGPWRPAGSPRSSAAAR
jgi:hypothetical protein